jgi:RHS repeat-associated protein
MIRSTDDNQFNDGHTTDADQFLYDGHDFDPEVDLQYNRARHYDPESGRWLNVEPVGYEDAANLYRYVGNAPCNVSDPTANTASAVQED